MRIDRVLLNLFGKPSKKKTSNGQSFAISSFRELGKIVFKFGKLFFSSLISNVGKNGLHLKQKSWNPVKTRYILRRRLSQRWIFLIKMSNAVQSDLRTSNSTKAVKKEIKRMERRKTRKPSKKKHWNYDAGWAFFGVKLWFISKQLHSTQSDGFIKREKREIKKKQERNDMLEAEESSRIPSKPTEKRRKQKRKKRKRKNHRRPEMSGDGRTAGPSSSSRSPLDLFLFRPRVAFFLAFFLEIFFHLGQIFRPFFFLFSRPAAALSAPNAILVGYRVFFFK